MRSSSSFYVVKLDIIHCFTDTSFMERSASKTILNRLESEGPGSTWTFEEFKDLPVGAVAKALSRLSKAGKIVRVHKGVYHYPKDTVLGRSKSSPALVVKSLNPKAYAGGASAAYNWGVTDQVPATTVYYGDVSSRESEILGKKVRFRRRDISHLKKLAEKEIHLIETLRNLKKVPGASPVDIILHLKKELKASSNLPELLKALEHEPPRVRALVGAACEELGLEERRLKKLRKSLNPLTHYSLGVKAVLTCATGWNIR